MKILIVSDSHKEKGFLDFLKKHSKDQIICLGDYCIEDDILMNLGVLFVNGNCDRSFNVLESKIIIEDKHIFFTHGHKYGVKFGFDRLFYAAAQNNSHFCLFGHTHQRCFLREEGIIFINPGAFCDGQYATLEDNRVTFYQGKKIYKIINF